VYLAACVQLSCGSDVERNLESAERLIRRAAGYGAALVATPENTPYLGPWDQRVRHAETLDGPLARRMGELARQLCIHLLVGSFPERALGEDGQPDPHRTHNTSLLFGPDGSLLASYRKMHLFDAAVPGGVTVQQSDSTVPGDQLVVAPTPLGRIGMSICYDVRFPEFYRGLVERGAEVMAIPAAFTLMTGKDHWHALLQARAIETQSWVLAPAQWGVHDDGALRYTYGHSMILDPWGTVVAECSDGEGICLAEVDLAKVWSTREAIPLAQHRRL